jgi:hypothetical protein
MTSRRRDLKSSGSGNQSDGSRDWRSADHDDSVPGNILGDAIEGTSMKGDGYTVPNPKHIERNQHDMSMVQVTPIS